MSTFSHNLSQVNDRRRHTFNQLNPPPRLLLGPGPSNSHPRVLQALAMPTVGHLDPYYLSVMNEIQELLRYAWQTENQVTFSISGTGSGGMEAAIANLVEPEDLVLVCINGFFGERIAEMAERAGARLIRLEKDWGEVFSLDEINEALQEHCPSILALVHAETSTGANQPLEGIAEICHAQDCLLVVDTVTSLAGVPLFLDQWGIDGSWSGSQKCLNCPPGLAVLSFSERAMAKIHNRKTKPFSWYWDINLLNRYWGNEHCYHHTAPVNLNYGLREALRIVAEESLATRWERHLRTTRIFWEGLAALGLNCHVEEKHRLASLTTVSIPEGVDGKAIQRFLLERYNLEIGVGMGKLAGKVWRVGLMGFNSRAENTTLLLAALKEALFKLH